MRSGQDPRPGYADDRGEYEDEVMQYEDGGLKELAEGSGW